MILAVIPARGGSKGIPRKNLQEVHGAPLIIHTIRHAQEAAQVDHVVVSTDDAEIATVASEAGADVVRRPAEIAGIKVIPWTPLLSFLLAPTEAVREFDGELRAMPYLGIDMNSPTMARDDFAGRGKPQARTARFGREKGLEHLRCRAVIDTTSRVN